MKRTISNGLIYIGTRNIKGEQTEMYRYGNTGIDVQKVKDLVNDSDCIVVNLFNAFGGRVGDKTLHAIVEYFNIVPDTCTHEKNMLFGRIAA